jgi:hypothetical protein
MITPGAKLPGHAARRRNAALGARRQEELPTYLAIRHALSDQTGDLKFLRRQPLGGVADATATRLA